MRILVVASGEYGPAIYGGGQVYVHRLVSGLAEAGHDVVVFSLGVRGGMRGPAEIHDKISHGITIRRVHLRWPRQKRSVLVELNKEVVISAREAIRDFHPDCVHANGWQATFAKACSDEGIPNIITVHHGGIVCPGGNLLNAEEDICDEAVEYRRCLQCCLRKHPVSSLWQGVLNALPRRFMSGMGAVLENLPKIPFASFVLKQPHDVERHLARIHVVRDYGQIFVAPSMAIGNALVRNDIDADRVTVRHHGTQPFETRPFAPGLRERPVRFGYVGRINRIKGYHVMIDAFSRLSPGRAELHVIGEAHSKWDKKYMKDVLRKHPVSNIAHHGHLNGTALAEKMAACDVIVLPTLCLEAFGLVIPEAFSLGRPVIVTKCGGPEELVRDGIDGLIVQRNDPAALADAMKSMIEAPERIRAMAENIDPVLPMDEHISDLENIYKTAIDAYRRV